MGQGYPNISFVSQGDPYKTIVVARLSFDVTEKKLRREFEEYGPIKRVRVVTDKNGKACTGCCTCPGLSAAQMETNYCCSQHPAMMPTTAVLAESFSAWLTPGTYENRGAHVTIDTQRL